jgi:hypothetical protein
LAVRSPLPLLDGDRKGFGEKVREDKSFLYVILFTIGKRLDMWYIDQYDDDYLNG